MAGDRTQYSLLNKESGGDRRFSTDSELLSAEGFADHERPPTPRRRSHLVTSWLCRLLLLGAVAVASFGLGMQKSSSLSQCIKRTSEYSPGLDVITKEYHPVRFDGRFSSRSPFKGPPSPEVDAAWNRIADMGVIRIAEEEYHQMNSSIHATKLPEELGGGYMGLPEFVHQIHCVHMLWKATYPEYYQHGEVEMDPEEMHDHMDHCADILRQKLMCDADMGIITYNWRKHHYRPHPNFNVQHQCRDFEAALQWGLDRQVDATTLGGQDYFTRPDHPVVDYDEPPFDPFAE